MEHLLSLCLLLPAGGALVLALVPAGRRDLTRGVAGSVAGAELLLVLYVWHLYDAGVPGAQFVERCAWVPQLGLEYHVGLDGLSLCLVSLSALLLFLGLVGEWPESAGGGRGFAAALLVAGGALIGAFAALDLLLFYFFAEAALAALFLLVGAWGRDGARAAFSLALHGLVGSLPLLVGALCLADAHRSATGSPSFEGQALAALVLPPQTQSGVLLAFVLYLAARAPLLPLHTWLGKSYRAAPAAGAALLAGAWLPMGAYGLLRFALPILPDAFHLWRAHLAALAGAGVLYGALLALVQRDVRRWVACLSLSQMGLVVFGLCTLDAQGLRGAAAHLLSHGLLAGGLLLVAGQRVGSPWMAAGLLACSLAAAGLPGLSAFWGQALVVVAGVRSFGAAALALVPAAFLLAWGGLRLFGPGLGVRGQQVRGGLALVPLLALSAWIGLRPGPVLERVEGAAAEALVALEGGEGAVEESEEPEASGGEGAHAQ